MSGSGELAVPTPRYEDMLQMSPQMAGILALARWTTGYGSDR